MSLVKLSRCYFGYPGRNLFQDFNLEIQPGLTWVSGSNGSGKSTLLRILAGATPFSIGALSCAGVVISEEPQSYRKKIYWMGPDTPAFDHLTAAQLWQFVAGLYPTFEWSLSEHVCTALGFSPFVNTPIRVLSSGNQRKAALIAALSVGSSVVLLDEPFNALDAAAHRVLTDFLVQRAADTHRAWVMTSHTLEPRLSTLARNLFLNT
jgi:ABC-type multidrug transport system ATPase subunit